MEEIIKMRDGSTSGHYPTKRPMLSKLRTFTELKEFQYEESTQSMMVKLSSILIFTVSCQLTLAQFELPLKDPDSNSTDGVLRSTSSLIE